jgi:hypothetical protein
MACINVPIHIVRTALDTRQPSALKSHFTAVRSTSPPGPMTLQTGWSHTRANWHTALAPLLVNQTLTPPAKRLRSLFGNVARRGPWVVPARMDVRVTFGNVELDFRDAQFVAGVTEINARVIFGNLEIFVPPQLAVDCEASSVLGSVESHGSAVIADPDRPLLRVRGQAVMGNIEIHTRLPGESDHAFGQRRNRQARPLRVNPVVPLQ